MAERFRLRELLGSGGTAAVYRAFDTRRDQDVALKLLHPHLAADPPMREAFFEEVRAAQSASHPALVEIYDSGVAELDPPVVWIALELVAGVTLADYVRAGSALPSAAVAVLADRLLQALDALHAVGVVHRDVSPQNVMFDPEAIADGGTLAASVRLLDFGLADVAGRTTRGTDALLSGSGMGDGVVATVAYAAPEQLLGRPVEVASDIYQAGATLFVALTGSDPFFGDVSAITRAHVAAPPPVPSARRRGIPRAWDRVITTAMLKDPEDRFAGAEAMRTALAAALGPAAARARPVAEPAGTAVTRPYRPAPPVSRATDAVAQPDAPPPAAELRARASPWPGWVAAGVGVAAIVGVVALSAAAGSAPSAVPTRTSTTVPVGAPPVSPTPSSSPSVEAVWHEVPPLVGRTLADARTALDAAGLATGTITTENGPMPAETVLGSDPPAGESRTRGAAVALRIASGVNTVPDVRGLSSAEATAALVGAGFAVATGQEDAASASFVTATSPAPNQIALVGSVVTMTIPSAAPVTPTPSPAVTPAPTGTATSEPTAPGAG
ncbi:hypothetical protein QE374_000712 [Microbacterium sp. SORGH_AS428]|uniref:protein kinase domain-containing protein n=1 Tax=Microbacterium sp. SORGH_AS_0428 TaxID=3041788 RepID=UPI00285FA94A|nr:PASTA domain-containing protein [Microbacterium sp. SORGH_AS_0428]MDR6198803.1 hypothetical protein [Microbacterium sp. SORGH_AS_0428]